MNKLITFGKRLAIAACVFGVAYLLVRNIPALNGIDVTIHGWAWAVIVAADLGFSLVQRFFKGFFGAVLKGTSLELNTGVAAFLDEVVDWVVFALALFATAAIVPALASYTSAVAILAIAVIIGVCSAICDVINKRITTKS